jgi:parallel beta-helix repeat protein
VAENNASYNTYSGIALTISSNIMIFGNNASHNTQYGIYLVSSSDNLIYFNNFLENILMEASCYNSSDNSWDNGTHGNYWGDYEVYYPSASNDGTIWDTPYQIDVNNTDYYPLVNPFLPPETTDTTDTTDPPTETEPIDPLQLILSIAILIAVGFIAVKKLIQKKDSDSEEDIYVNFQSVKQKRKQKKTVPDESEVKSYIYDPDEPRLD